MTGVLNFISHIGNYAGVGMIMVMAGFAVIIISVVKLSGIRRADRNRTVAEFNRKFVNDTHMRIADVEAGAARKDIARKLNIR